MIRDNLFISSFFLKFSLIWRDDKLYLNPGTPTDKRFTDINSYGYLRISNDKVEPEIIYL